MSDISRKIDNMAGANEALKWALENIAKALRAGPVVMTLGRETRTADQNAKLWPMLTDISNQVTWFDRKHSPEVWKDIITGSFMGGEFIPNLSGTGFVMVGQRTSKMNKETFSALLEYLYSFGAEQSIAWSEPSLQAFEQYREHKA